MMRLLSFGILVALIAGLLIWFFVFREEQRLINVPETGAAMHDSAVPAGASAPSERPGFTNYTSDKLGFRVTYPAELSKITEYPEDGGGMTILFEEVNDGPRSFQIYIQPYSGENISEEQFRKDEPSGVFNAPQDVVIDGIRATMFFGNVEGIGDTREVWFIQKGLLYEVMTYKELDTWLADIMTTWRFLK